MRFKNALTVLLSFLAFVSRDLILADVYGEPVLQIGWFTATQGKSQHIDIEGLIGDDFSVDKHWDQNLLVGVGYYFDGYCRDQFSLLYGINAFYLAPTKVKGDVTQEDLFTNLSYQYHRSNYPIYLAARTLINCYDSSGLVIDLGIGVNIVRTHGFKEKSLDGGITNPDEIFSGKTDAAFSATAGLGWRFSNLFNCFSFEVDYRFFYLGHGKLKRINDQVINALRTGNSYGNALFFTISF